jgi:hypothetical protein
MAVIDMTIPIDPTSKKYFYDFDGTFEQALWQLPGPCVDTNSTEYGCSSCKRYWTEKCYAPLFRTFFTSYGGGVVVQAQLGGRVEQYSSWNAALASTPAGLMKLKTDAKVDLIAATGLPGATGTHDPNVKNNALVCVGGSNTTCTKADIGPGASGAYAKSIDTSHKLLHYQIEPLSEMMDYFDSEVKLAVEQATQYYIQEQQQEWKDYYSKYQQCLAPFKCPHCSAAICTPKVR